MRSKASQMRGYLLAAIVFATFTAAPYVKASDDVEEPSDDIGDDADEAADDADDAADDAAEDADSAADEAAEEASDAAGDAAEDAGDPLSDDDDDIDDSLGEDADADDASSDVEDMDAGGDDAGDEQFELEQDDEPARENDDDAEVDAGEDSNDGEEREEPNTASDSDPLSGALTVEDSKDIGAQPFQIEIDENGDEVVADEILTLVADAGEIRALQEAGFEARTEELLPNLGLRLVSIKAEPSRAREVIERLRNAAPKIMVTRNHLFAAGAIGSATVPQRSKMKRHAERRGTVGLIDGAVNRSVFDSTFEIRSVNFGLESSAIAHGTAVASRLSDSGVRRIYSANIFRGRRAPAVALLRALDWMAHEKVPVINISLAGPENPLVNHAIKILVDRGHAVIAAVGNNGPAAPPLFPAALPGVVAVTAVDGHGRIYRRANRGSHVAFAAPGVDVPTLDGGGVPRVSNGTSFAAPVVSANVARVLAKPDVKLRNRAVADMAKAARDQGKPGRDPVFGHGIVRSR